MQPPAWMLQLAREESSERRVLVIAEGTAGDEAVPLVEPKRRGERLGASGFKAEPRVTAPSGFADDVGQHCRADATAKRLWSSAHRLHLAVIGCDLFQRTHSDEASLLARRPEGDGRVLQPVEGEDVTRLGRGGAPHLIEMELQQIDDIRAVEIAFVKAELV